MLRITLVLLLILSIAYAQENLRAPVALVRSGNENGAAIIVGEQNGQLYLLTAAHVIEDAQDLLLSFRGNVSSQAQVVNSDMETDLAAIRCPIPAGMRLPASYLAASGAPVFDQRVRVVGHPLGEAWDIVSGTVKDPIGLSGRFSITPTGIDRGCSGGPVLTASYELLGMVQQNGMQKAWCRSVQTLTAACRLWNVPVNLLTGIPEAAPATDPNEANYVLQLQQANTAFQTRAWKRAKTAYQQANSLRPSSDIQQRIRACEAELEKDRSYNDLYQKGLTAPDLKTALSYYRKAQQARNTAQIQRMISDTEKALAEIQPAKLESFAGPAMKLIPAGSFMMGSNEGEADEKPVHRVTVKSFYLGLYEVTVEEFEAFVLASGYRSDAEKDGGSYFWIEGKWEKKDGVYWKHDAKGDQRPRSEYNHPVIHVSWNDAQAYCKWLSGQHLGQIYRLPTEAEWEYAAGNGSSHTRYSWGNDDPAGKNGGNVTDESKSPTGQSWSSKFTGYNDGYWFTAPVGQYNPNTFGLYDMTGNVWEWCQDWYHNSYQSAPGDGSAWESSAGPYRVGRGGSWSNGAVSCRVANRNIGDPSDRDSGLGFRLARQF